MRSRSHAPRLAVALLAAALTGLWVGLGTAAAGTTTQPLTKLESRSFPSGGALGSGAVQQPEIVDEAEAGEAAGNGSKARHSHRSKSKRPKGQEPPGVPVVSGKAILGSTAANSFDGIDHFQQRFADAGNQFSVEPPDQGLCVGDGANPYVLESVNDAIRVYTKAGAPVTDVVSLNTFYGYPSALDRTVSPPKPGPFVTDPSCLYDPAFGGHFYHIVLTLDRDAAGALTGGNHIDIAVSTTDNPAGDYTFYSFRTEDDGSAGQPSHPHCPCIGDYPHIGADANGIYITTNEYSFFGPEFNSAQIYAISKAQLASGTSDISLVHFDELASDKGNPGKATDKNTPGFTVWPAQSNPGDYATEANGTEYFLSSLAAEEANGSGLDNRLGVWALTNTQALATGGPGGNKKGDLELSNLTVPVEPYGVPPPSDQKPGSVPLADCINDTTIPTPFGPGCWQFLLVAEPAHDEVEGPLDSSDSRMQQVWYYQGYVMGALDTIVSVGGQDRAGIAYFVVRPELGSNGRNAQRLQAAPVTNQGYVAVAGNNVIYPAIATLPSGVGIMAFTLVGQDHYPSAAYASFSITAGAGDVRVASEGLGPQDGFSEYKAFASNGQNPRPRWGDYGAADSDGASLFVASEYIGQTCTLAEYVAPLFGRCGNTRSALANWYTRITQITSP